MKILNANEYINERLDIKPITKTMLSGMRRYKYYPKTKKELESLIRERVSNEGANCDLNDIDVSKLTSLNAVFYNVKFNGDISLWDVRNVTDMDQMFCYSDFDMLFTFLKN